MELPAEVQIAMFKLAGKHFDLPNLSKRKTFVLERSHVALGASIFNSSHKEELWKAIERGDLKTLNHDFIEQLSTSHPHFHAILEEAGLPIPPTFIQIPHPQTGQLMFAGSIGRPLPQENNNLWVLKETLHRGKGVSFVRAKQLEGIKLKQEQFVQQFVFPPDRWIRDIRVYLVGGEPVAGLVRRAKKPLTEANEAGERPTEEQFPTAEHPGVNEPLEGELKEKIYAMAKEAARVLDARVRGRRKVGGPVFGWGAIDFLLDKEGNPRPLEFDTSPSITKFQDIHKTIAQKMAEFVKREAGDTHKIVVYGERDEFLKLLLSHLPPETEVREPLIVAAAKALRLPPLRRP